MRAMAVMVFILVDDGRLQTKHGLGKHQLILFFSFQLQGLVQSTEVILILEGVGGVLFLHSSSAQGTEFGSEGTVIHYKDKYGNFIGKLQALFHYNDQVLFCSINSTCSAFNTFNTFSVELEISIRHFSHFIIVEIYVNDFHNRDSMAPLS